MKIEMYRVCFEIQKKHWWFCTKKNIVLDTIKRFAPNILQKQQAPKILDVGCGSGLMLESLTSLGKVSGMDMSEEAIRFSKEIFKGRVEQGSLPNHFAYPNDCFDLITALDVIEHIDNDEASLKTLHKHLQQDGKIILTVPAYMFLWSKFDDLAEHKRRYTLKELETKLLAAGFHIEKISYFNTILFPIVYVVRKINNLLGRDGSSDMDMPNQFVNYILAKIFGLELFLLRLLRLPFGVSIIAVVSKK